MPYRYFRPWRSDRQSSLTSDANQQPRPYNNPGYMPNGAAGGHPNVPPGATPLLPNQGRVIQTGPIRVLCIADVRGTVLPLFSTLYTFAHFVLTCAW